MTSSFANTLVWVPIPDGVTESGAARIRVLAVPKLRGGTTIAEYGLDDWPGVLRHEAGLVELTMYTRLGGGDAVPSQATLISPENTTAWPGFFSGRAGEVAPEEDPRSREVTVADTHADARRVANTYGTLTTKLANGATPAATIEAQLAEQWAGAPAPPSSGEPDETAWRSVDFHRAVSLLREFPTVARELGLVFEVHVPAEAFQGDDPDRHHHTLTIVPTEPHFLTALVTPVWTRYEWRPGEGSRVPTVFRPAAADPTWVKCGLVDLTKAMPILPPTSTTPTSPDIGAWSLATFDVNAAASALRAAYADIGTVPTTMPPIRTTGITLLRTTQADDADARMQRAANRSGRSLSDAEFTAEDLLLGYRVDVQKGAGRWQSLCARNAAYTLGGDPIGAALVEEEGHVKPFAAVKGRSLDPQTDHLDADQVVFRWNGWSLAVPPIDLTGSPRPRASVDPDAVDYDFDWDFTVPDAALPPLRFAHAYRIRMRYVDLAGGALTVSDADALEGQRQTATEAFIYFRYDPIQPPLLGAAGPNAFATGSSVDTLVVRSDPEQSAADFAAGTSYPYPDTRTVYPPTVPMTLVEQHGMFDDRTDEESWKLVRGADAALSLDGRTPGLIDPAVGGVTVHVEYGAAPDVTVLEAQLSWGNPWQSHDIDKVLKPAPKTLRLKGSDAESPPITLFRAEPELIVTLAKGVQRTLEFSSNVQGDKQDHLAISLWPSSTMATIVNGRNQAISPVRRVLVVHAVKRPLLAPKWELPQTAVLRRARQTLAVLKPTFLPAGLHTESTGRLDIEATWTEVTDDQPEAAANTAQRTLAHFFSTPIKEGQPAPALAITHEFGDTKYRSVKYTLDAITRYREYFDAGDDPASFHWSVPQPEVMIASSARPQPLEVLGTYPAFRWDDIKVVSATRLEHRRTARTIRVELGRPWYQTGDGELLGVIVTAEDTVAQPDSMTRIGRDPLFDTPSPGGTYPDQSWFVHHPTASVCTASAPELAASVTVVPVAVTAAKDRWYADVTMTRPADSYAPLVGLAIARYQPNTLDGVPAISTIARADRVPLLPDRVVTIDRTGAQLRVTVTGLGPIEPANVVTAVLETASGPTDLIVTGDGPIVGVVAWAACGAPASGPLGTALPPLTMPAAGGRLRVRITEYEGIDARSPVTPVELGRRNALVDTIDLPEGWHG